MDKGKITVCLCSSRSIISKEKVVEVSRRLVEAGYTLHIEADLCEKAITPSPEMEDIASSTVIACYPRAVFSLFDRLNLKPLRVLDIRNGSSEEILDNFHLSLSSEPGEWVVDTDTLPRKPGQDAWYPVIDRERCKGCGKCHDFCLFGVYTMEKKEVKVSRPANCKINCPACARACPHQAIIFPKYPKSPINGGLTEEETVSVDPKLLYNEALKRRLEQRRATGLHVFNKK
jgi:NAD-dependent dihydropyrimidine dehydrogenase PreA subunit